jgi:hypothetical protein
MNKDEALQMCLEYIETDAHERKYVRHAIKQALAAPDLQAELDATNRQVEILSDALAESRREVAALKAVQEDWGPGPHEYHSLTPAAPEKGQQ